ncbi:hypothetical protein KEM48_013838 [Puccinia striiformis f. sp. tritici PST-130]|nr:hypothetical protein KEM48_013838 [Puccinia striiformis f. sp. tritici PST-130]
MFITKFSVSVTFAVLSLLTSMGPALSLMGQLFLPMPDFSNLGEPSINARSAGISQRMQEAIQMIQKDMWKIDNKLTIIEKYALPNLSYSKSSNLNEEIENTIQHSNHADGRCQRIVDTFPIVLPLRMPCERSCNMDRPLVLLSPNRSVQLEATQLTCQQLEHRRGYLRTINAARNTLIGVAQSGDATSFWT